MPGSGNNTNNPLIYYYPQAWGQQAAYQQPTAYQDMLRMMYLPGYPGADAVQAMQAPSRPLTPNEQFHKLQKERKKLLTKKLVERADRKEEGVVLNKFLLGCDPEFVALDARGQLINGVVLGNGEIGYDHSGRVLELRPSPSKGAYSLVKKLRTLLGDKRLQGLHAVKFRAGARVADMSLGGHVHFGVDPTTTTLAGGPIAALDVVTRLLEHLDILPRNECQLRRRGHYGRFGDVRVSHGKDGSPHLEYRTMASWLHDPKVAFLCLTLAKLAVCDPGGTVQVLKGVTSWSKLLDWVGNYRAKDTNAARVYEKLVDLKQVSLDPDVDFRGRWENLGL